MGDLFGDLNESQEQVQRLKAQAEQAAREAAKRWERCEPPYDNSSGIIFPWSERPWNLPLSDFEIGLAFKMAGTEDLNKVAKVLKVSIDRLESALERFPDWRALSRRRQRERERSQPRERDKNSPVSARFEGATLIVTVKKPRSRQKVEAGANEEGDFEIRFTRDDDRYRDIVKRAKEIAGEN
jgi:hypothetical protein